MMPTSTASGPVCCPYCGYSVASSGHPLLREERSQSGNPDAVWTEREINVTPIRLCESTGAAFVDGAHTESARP